MKYSEKLAVKYSDIVVTDNKVIQDYVRNEYKSESELIAYGADHVEKIHISSELKAKYSFLREKYAFKVCRIEPENNIHIILEAMAKYGKLNFAIIGNWSNSEYGKKLKNKYSQYENIFILDPIYDQNTLNQIRSNCYIYLHGHSAGGTNPSLVEAMALGLPTFAYGVNYNKETTGQKALYFDNSADLIELLEKTDENEIKQISNEIKAVAKERYNWQNISNLYRECF